MSNSSAARNLCATRLDSRLAQAEADLRRVADFIASERRRVHRLQGGEGDSAGTLVARVLRELTTALASNLSGLSSSAGDYDTVVSQHEGT